MTKTEINYQNAVNEYALSAEKLRELNRFDYWYIFEGDNKSEFINSDDGFISVTSKSQIDDTVFSDLNESEIGKLILSLMEDASQKISLLTPHPLYARNKKPMFKDYGLDCTVSNIIKSYSVCLLREPVAGFPCKLQVTQSADIIKLELTISFYDNVR